MCNSLNKVFIIIIIIYLYLIKKNSQRENRHCEFFLIRCKYSQLAANKFLRWLDRSKKSTSRFVALQVTKVLSTAELVVSSDKWDLEIIFAKSNTCRMDTNYLLTERSLR